MSLLFHVRRPMRVSLADRKEWRTNTTGFGPEWRSNTCGEKAGRKTVSKKFKNNKTDNVTNRWNGTKIGMLTYDVPLITSFPNR